MVASYLEGEYSLPYDEDVDVGGAYQVGRPFLVEVVVPPLAGASCEAAAVVDQVVVVVVDQGNSSVVVASYQEYLL